MNERIKIAASYLKGGIGMVRAWTKVGEGALNDIRHEAIMKQSDRVRAKAARLGYTPTSVQRNMVLKNDPVIRNFIPESVIKNPTQSAIVSIVRIEYGREEYNRLREAEAATLANLVKTTTEYLSLAPQVLQVLVCGVEKK